MYKQLRNVTKSDINSSTFFPRQKIFLRKGPFIHDRNVSFEILVQNSQNFAWRENKHKLMETNGFLKYSVERIRGPT